MLERFLDADVYILDTVFTDDRYVDPAGILLGHEAVPAGINVTFFKPEVCRKYLRNTFFFHFHRDPVDVRDCCCRYDCMLGNVAERRDLAFRMSAYRVLAPPDDYLSMEAQFPQGFYRVLRGFCFEVSHRIFRDESNM